VDARTTRRWPRPCPPVVSRRVRVRSFYDYAGNGAGPGEDLLAGMNDSVSASVTPTTRSFATLQRPSASASASSARSEFLRMSCADEAYRGCLAVVRSLGSSNVLSGLLRIAPHLALAAPFRLRRFAHHCTGRCSTRDVAPVQVASAAPGEAAQGAALSRSRPSAAPRASAWAAPVAVP